MIYIFAAAFNSGWGPVGKLKSSEPRPVAHLVPIKFTNTQLLAWVYTSEIPTNRLRAYTVALASFTHWVHNLIVTKATPFMLKVDPYRAYFIFGAFNLAGAVLAFWLPETKGVSLYIPC